MQEYSLPFAVSALADAISAQVTDEKELAALAAVFTQLGDTLATVLTVRALSERAKPLCTGPEGSNPTPGRKCSCP